MATWKLPLRREGGLVRRWQDVPTPGWVTFTGVFQPAGMRGRYELREGTDGDIRLDRYSISGRRMWAEPVPQGLSVWTYAGRDEGYTLPWQHPDEYRRVVALLGLELEFLHAQPKDLLELTLAKPAGLTPDGQAYETEFKTDGAMTVTTRGVKIALPSYVVVVEHLLPGPDFKEGRRVQAIYLWSAGTASGPCISPAELLKILNRSRLARDMLPWEKDLHRATFQRRK